MSDTKLDELQVTNVSCKPALNCLRCIGSLKFALGEKQPNGSTGEIEDEMLAIDRLIDIAKRGGLEARPARLGWEGLREAVETDAALLLLKNANVLAVIGNGLHDAVVAADPSSQQGALFRLTRTELERGWDGDTLIVSPLPEKERSFTWLISLLWVCAVVGSAVFLTQRLTAPMAEVGPTPTTAAIAETGAMRAADSAVVGAPTVALPAGSPTAAEPETPRAIVATVDASAASPRPHDGATAPVQDKPGWPAEATTASEAPAEPESAAKAVADPNPSIAATAAAVDPQPTAAVQVVATQTTTPHPVAAPPSIVAEPNPVQASEVKTNPPTSPQLSSAAIGTLITRGDSSISAGDVVSARSLYEHAAAAGNGPAALRLGETYDPQFLAHVRLGQVKGDRAVAAYWYRRAGELGVSEAAILLGGVEGQQEEQFR